MNFPLYQYSKELHCWIWLCSVQITGTVQQYMFPEGTFGYPFWIIGLKKGVLANDYLKNVKTIQIVLV